MSHEAFTLLGTVIYPKGSPEYRACTKYERELLDVVEQLRDIVLDYAVADAIRRMR